MITLSYGELSAISAEMRSTDEFMRFFDKRSYDNGFQFDTSICLNATNVDLNSGYEDLNQQYCKLFLKGLAGLSEGERQKVFDEMTDFGYDFVRNEEISTDTHLANIFDMVQLNPAYKKEFSSVKSSLAWRVSDHPENGFRNLEDLKLVTFFLRGSVQDVANFLMASDKLTRTRAFLIFRNMRPNDYMALQVSVDLSEEMELVEKHTPRVELVNLSDRDFGTSEISRALIYHDLVRRSGDASNNEMTAFKAVVRMSNDCFTVYYKFELPEWTRSFLDYNGINFTDWMEAIIREEGYISV